MCTNNTENSVRDLLQNHLSQQLSEFELLQSMYPNNDEIILTDSSVLNEIQEFLDGKCEYTPSHLDYTINIHINNMKLEMCIDLPTMYPEEEPDIYIRCNQLNRQQETQLNSELSTYIKNNHIGDVCIYTAISWIQDNIYSFASIENSAIEILDDRNVKIDKYVRLWIYSHHIYNKRKREYILKKAKELQLTGFCLPGKPGIICVEGTDASCNEWWKDIKSMSWKKITLRKMEDLESAAEQKFSNFEEIVFRQPVGRTGKHADMSEFFKFMDSRGLGQAFNDVFRLYNE